MSQLSGRRSCNPTNKLRGLLDKQSQHCLRPCVGQVNSLTYSKVCPRLSLQPVLQNMTLSDNMPPQMLRPPRKLKPGIPEKISKWGYFRNKRTHFLDDTLVEKTLTSGSSTKVTVLPATLLPGLSEFVQALSKAVRPVSSKS